ncbi:MAG: hypothetical protein WBX25_25500 [Rhodomicrobium sp.]
MAVGDLPAGWGVRGQDVSSIDVPMNHGHPWGITLVSVLMILFGLAEVATGFTHNFLGLITTTNGALATYGAAGIGALYAVGGLLILTARKWAAALALLCLAVVIVGRVALVVMGLFPLNSFAQSFAIVVGTSIAVTFAIYIGLKWKSFS